MIPHLKISHLTEQQLNELMDHYYNGEHTKDLIARYNLDIYPSNLFKIFPNIINHDLPCPYCKDVSMETRRVSRSAIQSDWKEKTFCPKCGHCADEDYCSCSKCREIERLKTAAIDEKKRSAISAMVANEKICSINVSDLSFIEILLLLSLIRHSLTDDLRFISPFISSPVPLTPHYNFTEDLICFLHHKKIIGISSTSSVESCEFNEEITMITGYSPEFVTWEFLPGMDSENKKSFIKDLEKMIRDEEKMSDWKDEITTIWRIINKYEAIEYYLYLLDKRGFKLEEIGKKGSFYISV